PSRVSAEERMARADALRRSGEVRAAVDAYLGVATDPSGQAFAEEAVLRAAKLELFLLGAPERAASLLDGAADRFRSGALLPERMALRIQIEREAGRLENAESLLDAIGTRATSLPLERERLALARAYSGRDPARAQRLVAPLLGDEVVEEIRTPARELAKK